MPCDVLMDCCAGHEEQRRHRPGEERKENCGKEAGRDGGGTEGKDVTSQSAQSRIKYFQLLALSENLTDQVGIFYAKS